MRLQVGMDKRLEQQFAFLLEADKSKLIGRQTYLHDTSRKENDAEHAWHLALMVYLLREYANEPVDAAKTMFMVLIHDLVEIDAGDTYAYDDAGNATKREREVKAAERIFNILPEDQAKEMRSVWEEFENGMTPEAKFARTLDKVQPLMLNDATDGLAWREHGVYADKVLQRNANTKDGSKVLWEYVKMLIERNVEKGNLKSSKEDS